MSSARSAQITDLESQQTARPGSRKPPRKSWRQVVFAILHARHFLFLATVKAKKGSYSLPAGVPSSAPSYSVIGTVGSGDASSKLTESGQVLPPSKQVSVNVHSDGGDDSTTSDRKLQCENIARIVKARDLASLYEFGGVKGIAEALNTDLKKGIPGNEEDLNARRMASSLLKAQAPEFGLFRLLLKHSNNYIIFLLSVAAALSLGFGIKERGLKTGWHEGVIIILAIIILVVIPSLRDLKLEKLQKQILGNYKILENRQKLVPVIRGGKSQDIAFSDIVIGEIVFLKKGCQVPGDGLFISGERLKLYDGLTLIIDERNPFIYYGAKVIKGNAHMLVTSVGVNTTWGEMMNQVKHTPNDISLSAQLDKVSTWTQIIGILTSVLILVVVFLRFELAKEHHKSGFPELRGNPKISKSIMDAIKRICDRPSGKISPITSFLTVMLVQVVEGVPFYISLAINYKNKKVLSDNDFAQDLLACVNMGLVTTICTDTTGGLTLNPREVDMCYIGEEIINADSFIDENVLEALFDGIGTQVLMLQSPQSPAEDPILSWAKSKLGMEMETVKQTCTIIQATNEEDRYGLLMKNDKPGSRMRVHFKGPANKILAKCSFYHNSEGKTCIMDDRIRFVFERIVGHMQSELLEVIAFAYKQVNDPTLEDNNLTLIGLIGLKHTCWIETESALESYRNAGVNIIMVSEANVSDLKAIAIKCGVLQNSDRLVLEGETFRNFTDAERMAVVDKIGVIGNCLPADKLLLVQILKQKEHVVAMVGAQTNETPALHEADMGVVMGTLSSDLAIASSDIYIRNCRFSFLVSILRCGRCIYHNIRKYIQLQLTMSIAGLLITTITTASFGHSPISGFQMSWTTLIVALLGGIALLTEPPGEKLMHKPPLKRTEPFITKTMWRNIATQSLYQTAILVAFQFKGQSIIGIDEKVSETMIFNSLVLCQAFNQFNARELEMKNVFKGIHQSLWFWLAMVGTALMQLTFIETAHAIFHTAKLNCKQWGICFLIGMLSLAVDFVSKSTSEFIMDWITEWHSSTAVPTADSNLELPLINGVPPQSLPNLN